MRLRQILAPLPLLIAVWTGSWVGAEEPRSILLATTTSVQDSGLLDALLPHFMKQSGIRVRVVAVGTGAALRMGAEGNADLLLTHAPSAERALVDDGISTRRIEFMENHFVLAGPVADPAGVGDAADILHALRGIREAGAPFISRADDSGTNKKEKALLRAAGLDPKERWPALTRTGSGMGLSLQVAGQRSAYILSDIGTFLAFREKTGLVILSKPEPALRNVYSVLLLDTERFPKLHGPEAKALAAFFGQPEIQALIADYGRERFGRALFQPIGFTGD
jgi:tungstate transport system substrate-binding protein